MHDKADLCCRRNRSGHPYSVDCTRRVPLLKDPVYVIALQYEAEQS
jgi:hypothetical protein